MAAAAPAGISTVTLPATSGERRATRGMRRTAISIHVMRSGEAPPVLA